MGAYFWQPLLLGPGTFLAGAFYVTKKSDFLIFGSKNKLPRAILERYRAQGPGPVDRAQGPGPVDWAQGPGPVDRAQGPGPVDSAQGGPQGPEVLPTAPEVLPGGVNCTGGASHSAAAPRAITGYQLSLIHI